MQTLDFRPHAFIWDSAHGMRDLNLTPDAHGAAAMGITNGGALVWDSVSGIQDLGTLRGPWSMAVTVNEHGQIAGVSRVPGDTTSHAFATVTPVNPLQGPQGAVGPACHKDPNGPAGNVPSGTTILLLTTVAAPDGYTLIGTTTINITPSGSNTSDKGSNVRFNVYRKN